MKAIIFQNGKSIEITVKAETNQDGLDMLNSLLSNGYISGFLMSLQKEDEN